MNYNSSLKSAEEVVSVITRNGGHATAIKADVSISLQVDHLFNEAKRIYGRVDIVIANSGIYVDEQKPMEHTDEKDFDKVHTIPYHTIPFMPMYDHAYPDMI